MSGHYKALSSIKVISIIGCPKKNNSMARVASMNELCVIHNRNVTCLYKRKVTKLVLLLSKHNRYFFGVRT